jgi:hypothetical protein
MGVPPNGDLGVPHGTGNFHFMIECQLANPGNVGYPLYPLVNVYTTMERSTIFHWVNPPHKWPFSIATLNYQRVTFHWFLMDNTS